MRLDGRKALVTGGAGAAFLTSDDATFITTERLGVSGGLGMV